MNNSSKHILMVRPASFGYNKETALDNEFQDSLIQGANNEDVNKALEEFDKYVSVLREHKIDVTVVDDTPVPSKPDSQFPNNWFTTHSDGTIYIYPLRPVNRRTEKRQDIIELLEMCFHVSSVTDLSPLEQEGKFLEGTGSIIFDRVNKIAYACLSRRTNAELFKEHVEELGYTPILFDAVDENQKPIYHTNVMLAIATDFVVICGNTIIDQKQKEIIWSSFKDSGKKIIDVSFDQLRNFTCNILEVTGLDNQKYITMSTKAFNAFTEEQKQIMEESTKVIHSPIDTIESVCGGGTRCMMAEIYLDEQLFQ
ncbi:amidinotransferase [Flammeovirga pectinis]|uniref:Amidinotransferase n=1 Tax=Flammeovirga pectinis TaxID=2494373 RepID=A0A3Q9FJE9_9BACT|nr:arginine deiminase-related protein [Flammeovirga pectinis]AZQ61008.1 amidinotransferase [Flammeovirga pectinis]